MLNLLARLRVPLGFGCAGVALALARPSVTSLTIGLLFAVPGEALRIWAAGHIDKGREITRSGPYRYVRHPLYLGSTALGVGFAAATRSWLVCVLAALYLGVTLVAAIRSEEATLDAAFAGAYSAYREGRAEPVERRFTWSRVVRNREYRAVLGALIAFGWLAWWATR
ncbi:MAG: isoprenylcysteine carboxylmethyltransferase family protein [Vicinamibacterales bacterium]